MKPKGKRRSQRHWLLLALGRGVALFFGLFSLVNVAVDLRLPGFDANQWWISLWFAPRWLAVVVLAVAGVVLVGFALRPPRSTALRRLTIVVALLLAAIAVVNGIGFYQVWAAGEIDPRLPVPFSFVIALLMLLIVIAAWRPPEARRGVLGAVVAVVIALCVAAAFAPAQIAFYGLTDYRRPADVAVVFGAEVHPGGRPSTALADRVNTAIGLYREGKVKRLLMSGGVGASGYDESLVMRDMALKAGLPAKAIIVDGHGVNTEATVTNTAALVGDRRQRLLAVSQFYHLPRIKLAYARAGWRVGTVPAETSHPIPQTTFLTFRETVAFWVYYLRAVAG